MAKKQGVRNFVHKHSIELNRATVEVDRKKALKRGYCKHKGGKQAPFDFLAFLKMTDSVSSALLMKAESHQQPLVTMA